MKLAFFAALTVTAAIALTGCVTTSDIAQTGPNTFTVSASGDDSRALADTRDKTLAAAHAKCQSLGRTMQVVSDKNERTQFGGSVFPKHTLTFRCL